MTGQDIVAIRTALGLNAQRFAQLVGVHVTTAYRWEAAGTRPVRLDPLHESLLLHMQRQIAEKSAVERKAWSKEITETLLIGGTLVGLAVILAGLLGGKGRS